MSENEKDTPFTEFKHNLNEVLELLNQSNMPVAVSQGEAETGSNAASAKDIAPVKEGNEAPQNIREG